MSVIILSRLLTPEDIGIYTIGLALIGLAHMFRDFGIGKYIIQEKSLTKEKVASALGLTFLFAWLTGCIVLFLAPYIAEYYDEPAVESVTYIVAINFFLIPVGAMSKELLKRSMSFGTLFKINFFSTLASVVTSIALALMGFGFFSMAWATVVSTVVSAAMSQFYLPAKYRVLPTLKNSRPVLNFGRHVLGANLLVEAESSIKNLVIGKVLGFSLLGLFSRAEGYVKLYDKTLAQATNRVIYLYMAKINRSNEDLEQSFYNSLNYVSVIGWFFLGYMGLMSSTVIQILFGDQWTEASVYASILCVIGCLQVPIKITRFLFDATGYVRENFQIVFVFTLLRILLLFVFIKVGLTEMLLSFLMVAVIEYIITNLYLRRLFSFSITKLLKMLGRNVVVCAFSLSFPLYYYFDQLAGFGGTFQVFFISGLISLILWIVIVCLIDHPICGELKKAKKMLIKTKS